HTIFSRDWSSDVCSSDLYGPLSTLFYWVYSDCLWSHFLLQNDMPKWNPLKPPSCSNSAVNGALFSTPCCCWLSIFLPAKFTAAISALWVLPWQYRVKPARSTG